MISILITTHGKTASGMYDTLKMLFGVNENIVFEDFTVEDTSENLKIRINEKINKLLKNSDGVICLTDIKGGTPFKVCSELSLENNSKISVICGTNIGMLISLASEMEDINLSEACEMALEIGKSEIEEFKLVIKKQIEDLDDGI